MHALDDELVFLPLSLRLQHGLVRERLFERLVVGVKVEEERSVFVLNAHDRIGLCHLQRLGRVHHPAKDHPKGATAAPAASPASSAAPGSGTSATSDCTAT